MNVDMKPTQMPTLTQLLSYLILTTGCLNLNIYLFKTVHTQLVVEHCNTNWHNLKNQESNCYSKSYQK